MKTVFLIIRNLKTALKQKDKTFFVVIAGITVTVVGMLFYFGYFLHDYYSPRMSTECVIELRKDSNPEEVYSLTKQLIELSDEVYSFCISSDGEKIVFSNGTSFPVAGLFLDDWKDLLQGGKIYPIDEEKPKLLLPVFNIQNFKIDKTEPLIGKTISDLKYVYAVEGVVDPFWQADVAIPPLVYANSFKSSEINIVWKNKKTDLVRRGLEKCLQRSIVANVSIKDISKPLGNTELRQIATVEIIAFGVMTLNIFVLVYYWLDKNKNRNYIYALCGASKHRVQLILFGMTVLPSAVSMLFGALIYYLILIALKQKDILYSEGIRPYLPVFLLVFVVLCLFCFFVSKKVTQNRIIYKAVE